MKRLHPWVSCDGWAAYLPSVQLRTGWCATVVSEGVHKGTWRGTGPSVQNLPRDTTDSVSTEEQETK